LLFYQFLQFVIFSPLFLQVYYSLYFWFIAILPIFVICYLFTPFPTGCVNTFFCGQDPTWEDSKATQANMLSKMVKRKLHGFKTQVTDNLKFQAPIPLYLEPDKREAEVDKVKVKLRRNPGQTTLPIYKKTYTPLDGSYGWGLLPIPSNAQQIHPTGAIKQREQAGWSHYASSKWNATFELAECPLQTPDGHSWDEEAFKTALKSFALKYCGTTARQEQKRFMKRNVGLPSNQLTSALLSWLPQFNRYLPYLPGVGNKFDPDDIREMLYNALPAYVHTIIATASGSMTLKPTVKKG
jgi:hypothetical protein